MAVPLAESIINLCKEGLGAYKTYLATRQEAYNRKQDKKQVKAIESAEKYILLSDSVLDRIELENYISEFKDELKDLSKHKIRFFKYN